MNVLDVFCGAVGGWSLGLHRAGYRTVAACEIDPWRRSLYSSNFPGVRVYGDVRELTAERLVSDIGFLPDVIAGSPPCQDASAANPKGKGIDGAETGLFLEALRLVREVRPAWAFFENSPRMRTRGVDRVLSELEAAGYAKWPLVVGADDLGAPHERKRMWLIAADTRRPITERRGSPGGRERRTEETASLGPVTHAYGGEQWIEPRRWIRAGGTASPGIEQDCPEPADSDAHAGRVGTSAAPDDGRGAAGQCAAETGDTHGAGLEIRESLTGDARAQFEALERAVGPAVHTWNGGVARHLGVAHGVAAKLACIRVPDHKHPGATINAAKACISAQGDAILPQISEAIGRAVMTLKSAQQENGNG